MTGKGRRLGFLLFLCLLGSGGDPAPAADKGASLREMARAAVANGAPGAAREAPREWPFFTSEAGRFSVAFPVLPALSQRAMAVGTATVVNHQARATLASPAAIFSADYREVPPAWAKAGLPAVLDEASSPDVFAMAGLRVEERKRITVGGFPAVDVLLDDPGGLWQRARMIVRGGRLHTLAVTWPKGDDGQKLAERFLASFRFAPDLPVAR